MQEKEMIVSAASGEDTFEALRPYVVPIFSPDDQGRIQVEGSGVLLRVSDENFLLTAAHVLDSATGSSRENTGKALYLPIRREPWELDLATDCFRSVPPEGDRRLDTLDVGLLRLRSAIAKGLSDGGYLWLVPANLELTEVDRPSYRALYGFMGYPNSQSRRNPKRKTLRRRCYQFSNTPLTPGQVTAKDLRPEAHIALPVEKRKGLPRLEGMSGGAVWSLRGHLRHGPRLAAISIENRTNQQILVGVRVKFFVAALIERFPELAFALPTVTGVAVIHVSE